MMEPIVSVIVPVYNVAKYLRQCLQSICNQTFSHIEIICINDGSTDGSGEILREFAAEDPRITVIHREHASGSAALPRNMGLDIARGKYVSILDSDDYFDLTMLEKMVAQAESLSSDLVMCDNFCVSSLGELDTDFSELHPEYLPEQEVFSYKDIPDTIFQISNATAWHKLILRDTIERYHLRFQEGTPSLDDIYFVNLILVLSKRISLVRERLVYYRFNREDAQTSKIDLNKDSIFLSFYALNTYLKDHLIYDEVKLSIQNWTIQTMFWWVFSCVTYSAFTELFDLYHDEYFEKLGLMDVETIYGERQSFYDSVLRRDRCRTIRYALDHVLEPGSHIAIYGAGVVGEMLYREMERNACHSVVVWCDKKASAEESSILKPPSRLLEYEFDAVFVAIGSMNIAEEVQMDLIRLGVEADSIYIA